MICWLARNETLNSCRCTVSHTHQAAVPLAAACAAHRTLAAGAVQGHVLQGLVRELQGHLQQDSDTFGWSTLISDVHCNRQYQCKIAGQAPANISRNSFSLHTLLSTLPRQRDDPAYLTVRVGAVAAQVMWDQCQVMRSGQQHLQRVKSSSGPSAFTITPGVSVAAGYHYHCRKAHIVLGSQKPATRQLESRTCQARHALLAAILTSMCPGTHCNPPWLQERCCLGPAAPRVAQPAAAAVGPCSVAWGSAVAAAAA